MRESEFEFASHDEESTIHVWLWEPDDLSDALPRGIVQIIHGASEYAARYRDFARFLTDAHIVVCADDHIGHGLSAVSEEKLGHLPASGGLKALIADEDSLRKGMVKRYDEAVPYIMFGHSMGSFILRSYIARHGEGLAAAILSGTGHQPANLSSSGNMIARIIARFKGATYRSPLLHNMGMGALSKGMDNPRTPLDWLNTDADKVDEYLADPHCGMVFTAGGYATLTELTGDIVKPKVAANVPEDLPLLFISGDADPVGEMGQSVNRAVQMYKTAGVEHVDLQLYAGMRHEILNEPGHQDVYRDVLEWIEPVLL
ncbi:MAG: lysophospholipase [Coriobacteriales bacterium]|jgi:alpha-beta hydrolase superfamily lysophospholipase|nr:lysophospholipase [Coriobacteriales bacterium]